MINTDLADWCNEQRCVKNPEIPHLRFHDSVKLVCRPEKGGEVRTSVPSFFRAQVYRFNGMKLKNTPYGSKWYKPDLNLKYFFHLTNLPPSSSLIWSIGRQFWTQHKCIYYMIYYRKTIETSQSSPPFSSIIFPVDFRCPYVSDFFSSNLYFFDAQNLILKSAYTYFKVFATLSLKNFYYLVRLTGFTLY